ncbi:MAG: hypothetical protein IPK71_05625 [Myxococcales bacterium]|nr:hypothetical protein [Myxococcales bacterium]
MNGRATLTTDEAPLVTCEVEGKVPTLGIEQAYTHCSKAFLRSALWDPSRHLDRAALATNGAILRAIHGEDFDAETYDRERAARYARREGGY